ncbi:Phloem protein, partial [Trema orientale]
SLKWLNSTMYGGFMSWQRLKLGFSPHKQLTQPILSSCSKKPRKKTRRCIRRNGFDERPVKLCVHFEEREDGDEVSVFLDPSTDVPQLALDREDRWKEIEMGEFFNLFGEDGLISYSLKELSCSSTWSGLIIEGIELRPRAA